MLQLYTSGPTGNTVCPGISDPFYTVTYYKNWVTTSWTHSTFIIARHSLGMLQMHWREKERGREKR